MELPACALGVKGKGIVVRQPLPSAPPQLLLHELAVSSQASCVKNPSIQKQKKKKKAKINLQLFQLRELFMA